MSRVVTADAFGALADMDAESVHAVVTDPPYGLAFMGRDWDDFEPREYQGWCERWAALALDVLKPGGHLLAFSGNRTHHRLFSGVEDAGFEIRDTLTWHYGSGFPKALDVSKAIDKKNDELDAAREAFGQNLRDCRKDAGLRQREVAEHFPSETGNVTGCVSNWELGYNVPTVEQWAILRELIGAQELDGGYNELREMVGEPSVEFKNRDVIGERDVVPGVAFETDGPETLEVTAPATEAAERWNGWKTALKPATEFIVLARKPFEGTVAENVQAHGTGALNIDGCRIGTEGVSTRPRLSAEHDESDSLGENWNGGVDTTPREGRYPANVMFDAEAAERLDREVGESEGSPESWSRGGREEYGNDFHPRDANEQFTGYGDTGGPSRYFYTSKATRAERTLDGKIENAHPTVKPIDLMEWLVRLVTAEGQHVLDPFCGTGTTGRAAKNLGREFTLIEQNAEWADVARARCGLTPEDPSLLTPDGQATLT